MLVSPTLPVQLPPMRDYGPGILVDGRQIFAKHSLNVPGSCVSGLRPEVGSGWRAMGKKGQRAVRAVRACGSQRVTCLFSGHG
jgi:hypothetical protein